MTFTARFLITVLFLTALFACRGKEAIPGSADAVPGDSLISQDKMVLLLTDVHVVEAALLLERNEGVEAMGVQSYYPAIFKKHHVTAGRYDQSLLYYRQNPEMNARIYDKVIRMLEDRQKQVAGKK